MRKVVTPVTLQCMRSVTTTVTVQCMRSAAMPVAVQCMSIATTSVTVRQQIAVMVMNMVRFPYVILTHVIATITSLHCSLHSQNIAFRFFIVISDIYF